MRLRAIRLVVSLVIGSLSITGFHLLDRLTNEQTYSIIFWGIMTFALAVWLTYNYRKSQKRTGDLTWSFTKKAF